MCLDSPRDLILLLIVVVDNFVVIIDANPPFDCGFSLLKKKIKIR